MSKVSRRAALGLGAAAVAGTGLYWAGSSAPATGFTPLSHSDQGGWPDAMQIMVQRGHAYVGHIFSGGFSVIDVRDPRAPKPVAHVPSPPNTWNIHLQTHDNLLLVIHALNLFADPAFADESNYYGGSVAEKLGAAARGKEFSSGMAIYDIADPARPRRIGFLPIQGIGAHRIWYTGGRWAYVSALLEGYSDYILLTVDLSEPAKPVEAGRFWLPGMHAAGGESPTWDPKRRYALHHAIVAGDTAYASWRDGGLTLIDVKDRSNPKLISHRNWSPPFAGGTHRAVPLPSRDLAIVLDEAVADDYADGRKNIWTVDVRAPENPVVLGAVPLPAERDFRRAGAHFGPHNLHENRPASFVSDQIIFATWQNAGVRAYDLADPYRPEEMASFVPPAPARMVDTRLGHPRVIQSTDVFVDAEGVAYVTDYNAGLHILQFAR